MSTIYYSVLSLICPFFIVPGIYGQVTVPPSTTAGLGEDVSLECTTTETDPTFTWTYTTESQLLYYGDDKSTNVPRYANIVLQGGTNAQTSILNIIAIQLEEEGEYLCSTTTATTTPPTTTVTVEVASASKEIDLISIDDFANYQATCDAIGSKPEETITWVLNGDTQHDGSESDPGTSADPLFDKRSVFKFPASLDNYNVTLVCEIGGHQDPVSSLNRQESRRVDIHKQPQSGDIVIKFTSEGTLLTVLCDTEGAAAIPPMDSFFIYSALIDNPESGNTVTFTLPQNDTEFTCVGGNYLDNTTTTTTFEPGNPTQCTCVPTGLNSGASAGIAVLTILLVASVIINIIQFIMLRRHETRPGFEESEKTVSGEERNASHEANDNTAYEMIQSGDKAYTSLKLGPSHSPIIAPENVTFFTRLGSIGRGDFGGVWKGELRSNQSQVDVAIRQIPDQVTKSTNVLQAVNVLSELPDQPNVVKCLGYCQEQGSILYEFIAGGTLLTHLQTTGVQSQPTYGNLKPKRVRIDEGSLLNLAWQIAKGMQYLASKKIIHGTLCAHNVLLADRKQCKLSDYGLSSSLFSGRGKPTRWSSPETMVTGDQSTEDDIWSCGIVLWEIVTLGARPYPKMTFDTVQKEVANGYQMPRPRHCGQEVYAVMSGCWEKEATNRSNFDQILKSLEMILEKTHNYLSLNDLDEGLYASTLDM